MHILDSLTNGIPRLERTTGWDGWGVCAGTGVRLDDPGRSLQTQDIPCSCDNCFEPLHIFQYTTNLCYILFGLHYSFFILIRLLNQESRSVKFSFLELLINHSTLIIKGREKTNQNKGKMYQSWISKYPNKTLRNRRQTEESGCKDMNRKIQWVKVI